MTHFRRLAPVFAVALAALITPSLASAACPEGTTCEDAYFESGDGTQLHADVIKPVGSEGKKLPVILSIGPYFAHSAEALTDFDPTRAGPNERFKDMYDGGKIFQRGYALVQADLRGFGASAGCNDFGGSGEQMDVKAAVEWAAAQDWSNGRVGMWGKSYDGWTQVMALDEKPKGLAAAVIQSPIIDGYRTLYMNGVHYDSGWYGTPALYQGIDSTPPTLNDDPEYVAGFAQGTNPPCYAQNIAMQNSTLDRETAFWKERDLPNARGSDVAVLWSHGLLDANTKPDNFLDVWQTLKGPHRAWYGQFLHSRGNEVEKLGRKGFLEEAMRWFDRYVKGLPPAEAPVENDPVVEVEDGATKKWRAEAAWPPADATPHAMKVNGGTSVNRSGNYGEVVPEPGLTRGAGIWSVSSKLPHDVHMSGVPVFSFTAGAPAPPRVNVHGIVYDINADGLARLVSRGAIAVTAAGQKKFELYPQDWTFAAGHRVGFLIAQSDDEWYLAPQQSGSVAIDKGSVQLPFLRYLRSSFLPSKTGTDEASRPAPFDVKSLIVETEVEFALPPQLTTPPAAVLPGATSKPRRLTVKLGGKSRRLVASGRAPRGLKLTVKLVRGGRTVATKRVTARTGDVWRAVFRARRAGRYRVTVSAREAGSTTKVRSKLRRVR